ncbi:unnamed protein product [Ceutorhynchus assimilis]|uniref:Fibroblast growth factor n=1 Tax=Ceutorhynchus assimilis TaxID=467358 RepID=A0A9P0GPY3_9CUCU|nr:unnamed protein product [Ceutorhynchus assimilis]
MVKALLLGLLLFAALARAAPSSKPPPEGVEDPAARSERSANLSHVTGTARKIKMFIKNRHLQLLPGGTVNGTTDDTSPYTILQRTTIGIGQMKIQGVATCQYLCMDECGLLYGAIEFGEECIFNETIEATNYNKYSSSKYSNERRTFYLALNRRGQPRKVMIKARQQLGKLSSYTRVLTRSVTLEQHQLRHHHQCPPVAAHPPQPTDPPRCRKKKKKKKKKRKNSENESELEPKKHSTSANPVGRVKCDNATGEIHSNVNSNATSTDNADVPRERLECQRDFISVKPETNVDSAKPLVAAKKNKNNKKKKKINNKQRKRLDQVDLAQENTTTVAPTTTSPDDIFNDEDYPLETSTHMDWEESTGLPDISKNSAEIDNVQSNSD